MGYLHIVRDIPSLPERTDRTVRVYTPDAYDQNPRGYFPVVYLHDGQNVFDHPESEVYPPWGIDTTLEHLIAYRGLHPWILVAIDHRGVDRLGDYSPFPDAHLHIPARADAYARFLVEHLKPWIDRSYRTLPARECTAVIGSSMGGLFSLYLGFRHANTFGRIGALSPSVMIADHALARAWNHRVEPAPRIYLDAGEHERFDVGTTVLDYGRSTRAFHHHLESLGYPRDQLRLVLEPGGQHSERDWRRRLPSAMAWLLR